MAESVAEAEPEFEDDEDGRTRRMKTKESGAAGAS